MASIMASIPVMDAEETLGETGGDTVTTTLGWGHLAGVGLFAAALIVLAAVQTRAKAFDSWLYWTTVTVVLTSPCETPCH
jgi:uncharacterized membrane-anchored protein